MSDTDIAVLFARDPLQLTRADIDKVILALRAKRKTFGVPVEKPKRASPRRATKSDKLLEGLDVDIEL